MVTGLKNGPGDRAWAGPPWRRCQSQQQQWPWGKVLGLSMAPGQPGVGVRRPALSAQGWRSPLGPLPADEDSRLGLRPTPSKCNSSQWWGRTTAYLLILGCPVEMGFSIHVQQQQVTEEGDLGEAGQTRVLAPAYSPTPSPQPSP